LRIIILQGELHQRPMDLVPESGQMEVDEEGGRAEDLGASGDLEDPFDLEESRQDRLALTRETLRRK
jgi:hypothetical protein